LAEQAQRIIDKTIIRIALPPDLDKANRHTIAVLLQELSDSIEHTLKSCMFLRIHTDKIKLYSDDDLPLFGQEVRTQFDEASHDITEAGRCFALERWDGFGPAFTDT
jgi:hypothetical protein